MIGTERLSIFPLSPEDLSLYLEAGGRFEKKFGLRDNGRIVAPDVRLMVEKSTIPKMKLTSEADWKYITFWIVVEKASSSIVAELGFKGAPDGTGSIEIGYGTMPGQRGKGFMTEAVGALVQWAFLQPEVNAVLAETNIENIASIRVVEKNQFQKLGLKGKMYLWKKSLAGV